MDSQEYEQFHQDASAHYLAGEYQAALECWHRVLEGRPDDERAIEGVRLCEQFVGSVESSVCTENVSPFAVGPGTAAADAPLDAVAETFQMSAIDPETAGAASTDVGAFAQAQSEEELQDSFSELDDMLSFGDPPAAEPVAMAAESDALDLSDLSDPSDRSEEDPDGGSDDLSFEGWLDEPSSTDSPEPAAAPTNDDSIEASKENPDDWSWGKPVESSAGSSPQVELRRRVNELLASALVYMEKGEPDEALRNLDRLLILEETNDTAQALKHKILRGDRAQDAEDDRFKPRVSESLDDGIKLDLAELYPDKAAAAPAAQPDLPPLEMEDDFVPGSGPQDLLPDSEDDMSTETSAPARKTGKRTGILIAAVVLVALAGLAWNFLGPELSGELPTKTPGSTPPVETGVVQTQPDPDPVPPRTDPSPPVRVDIAAVLGNGHTAMKAGEYAAAVVAFNQVLAVQPDNAVARSSLARAGEEYRKQQEGNRQRELAVEAFENQDYHAALRLIYRLPTGDDPQRIETYKFNGWFNLGLTALKSGNCDRANEHFTEARSIRSSHPELPAAFGHVVQCQQGWGPDFRDAVDRLEFRGLED